MHVRHHFGRVEIVDRDSGAQLGGGAGTPSAWVPWRCQSADRVALIDLLQRYGRHHPTGVVMIPEDRIQATVHYTAHNPTHGHLREAFVVAVEPIGSDGIDGPPPRDASYVPAT